MSVKLTCSKCGATATAGCDCGVPYLPAGQRAAEALAANPGLSDRAIAEAVGVDAGTVRFTRLKLNGAAPVGEGVEASAPVKRIGLDGKAYPVARMKAIQERPSIDEVDFDNDDSIEDGVDPIHLKNAFLARAGSAIDFAVYTGKVDRRVIEAARRVADRWTKLADGMETKLAEQSKAKRSSRRPLPIQ